MRTWVLLVAISCLARNARAERLPVQSYTADDGLANNHINRIRQDSRGFLWFATDGGLSRFDGQTFSSYTTSDGLPHPWVNDLIETRDGSYWAATDGGVCRLDISRPKRLGNLFTCYEPGTRPDARRVNALVENPAGGVWCATYDGIYLLTGTRQSVDFHRLDIGAPPVHEGSLVNNLLIDRLGALWAASRTGLYHRLADDRWERFSTEHGLPDDFVETVFEDRAGRLWVGTRTGGVCRLDARKGPGYQIAERCYSTREGLGDNDVRSLCETADGRLWIGTGGGLSRLEPSGEIITYSGAHGLSDAAICKLIEDRERNLWAGTKHAGVMRLDSRRLISYGVNDGFRPGDYASSIFESPSGELCVSTGTSSRRLLQCLAGRRFTTAEPHFATRHWGGGWGWEKATLWGSDGDLWLPTGDGLFRYRSVFRVDDLASARPARLPATRNSNVGRAYPEPSGDIWFAFSRAYANHLARVERSSGAVRIFSSVLVPGTKRTTAITRDRVGWLWIGFDDSAGIVRCLNDPEHDCQAIKGAPRGDIRALYPDRAGRMWAASSGGGLVRYDVLASGVSEAARYTTASGLSSNDLWCLAEDSWGRIYAGTDRGVDRIDPATGAIRHFTSGDGLGHGVIQAAYRDRKGTMWFATHQVVARLDPVPPRSDPPPVRITAMRVGGLPRSLSEMGESRLGPFRLAPSDNSIEIEYAGLSLGAGRELRFQFRFEGTGSQWNSPTDARAAVFHRISPGSYRFLVRALDSEGVGSAEPAAVAFSIDPPIWQRWWALLLAALAMGLTAFAFHRSRLARALEMERVRCNIAADLHDEIGSSLSRMAILSEVVQRQLDGAEPASSKRLLGEIAGSARGLIDGLSDLVWSIDPSRDNLASLAVRIREFASDMLEGAGIRWTLDAPSSLDKVVLRPEQRRDLYLIFKEAVTNLVRHASCSSARLVLELAGPQMRARILDDGCGIPPDARRGQGLSSIEARVRRLGGRCEIVSEPGQGTRITITVPLR